MSWLAVLNFIVLQWFCIRLARVVERQPVPGDVAGASMCALGWITEDEYRCLTVTVGYTVLRWVVPLTGWWSDYVWIARRGACK